MSLLQLVKYVLTLVTFFRYAKKSSVLREDLVQLRNPDGATIDDRSDICE